MQQRSATIGLHFTPEQTSALVEFTQRRPCSLYIEIATDHEELPEVAEVFRAGGVLPLFFFTPIADGTIELCDPLSPCGGEYVATLDAALARVVEIEEGG